MRGLVCMALLGAFTLAAPEVAGASDFDGSKRLVCVATDKLSCEGAGDCRRATAEDLGIPRFIDVDFRAKTLSGKLEDGAERRTSIQSMTKLDGRSILQGTENGRGWSMVIMHDSGDMSGAIAGEEVAFVLLGACTPR
ncbi:MAG: hypothetical protein QNK03_09340 [Myxococcota bacterium]|nr:hypothetical protein [Myxococcota bacterium]